MIAQFPYSFAKKPPIPAVLLTLTSPDGSRSVPDLTGFLDTAADRTVVPLAPLQQLGLQQVAQVHARGFGTALLSIGVYRLILEIPGVTSVTVDALGHSNEPEVLVGRDVLNQLRATFDGPNNTVEFH